MYFPDDLKLMTVAQLRKYAKEQGIELSSSMTKQAIIDKISEAQPERAAAQQSEPRPVRQALIISDDSDDIPVMTVNPRPRPQEASAKPAVSVPRPPAAPPKGNKPAFNLQGARAWHNPQPFAAVPPAAKYAPVQQTQPINVTLSNQRGMTDAKPQVRPVTFTRFGPDVQANPEEEQASAPQRVYRPSYDPSQGRGSAPQSPAQREEVAYTPSARGRELPGMNMGIPEMLATGDCGEGEGVLEIHPDGYGFLRAGNYLPGREDVYVSNAQIRRFSLRSGDYLKGKTRPRREMDRYSAMLYITEINGEEVDERTPRREFEKLTPIYPAKRIKLSGKDHGDLLLRIIDLIAPVGLGQRGLLLTPPQIDRMDILLRIAAAAKAHHPDITVMLLLADERPEEVTAVKARTESDVLYATFDEPPENSVRVSEMVVERAKRLAEAGQDVLILINDFHALSRAYNNLGAVDEGEMRGCLAAGALNKPRQLLGAARNLKEGGSVTMLAAVQQDESNPFSRMVLEDLRHVVNAMLVFDEGLDRKGLRPAVSLSKSRTMKADALHTKDEQEAVDKLHSLLHAKGDEEALGMLVSMLEKTNTNREFVSRLDSWLDMMK